MHEPRGHARLVYRGRNLTKLAALGVQELDCNIALELFIARSPDLGHATRANKAQELVSIGYEPAIDEGRVGSAGHDSPAFYGGKIGAGRTRAYQNAINAGCNSYLRMTGRPALTIRG